LNDGANADQTGGANKQKGIVQWGLSANRQNPIAGVGHDAIFNTFRRTKSQIFYWLPAALAGYYIMNWATERYVPRCLERPHARVLIDRRSNHYLNSKAGRAELADEE
jgi:ubiquinol-cytochrome c reductase subunit 8